MDNMDGGFAMRKGAGKNLPVSLALEHVSPVTRLLEKKQEKLIVQDSLDKQKDDYARKEELFKRREESLRKKDLELQEALVLFNKFLRENEHKRKRQDQRANQEIVKRNGWIKMIGQKELQLKEMQDKLESLKRKVEKNEKYLKFLTDVYKDNTSHFEHETAIIKRQETLEDAHNEMKEKQKSARTRNENLRKEYIEYKKDQYNRTLILNNDSAALSDRLAEKAKVSNKLEESVKLEEKFDALRKKETTELMMAVENLYVRCRNSPSTLKQHLKTLTAKEKENKTEYWIKKHETCRKLDVIADFLEDFQDIVETISSSDKSAQARSKASEFYSYHRRKPRPIRQQRVVNKTYRQKKQEEVARRQNQRDAQEREQRVQRNVNPNESMASNMNSISGSETSNLGSFGRGSQVRM